MNLKDIQKYLFPLRRIFSKYRKIKTTDQIKTFIQEQSSHVSQITLYGYLKTRMGAKHVLMFEDKEFLNSINIAKWHVYASSLVDCTFFCFSFLHVQKKYLKMEEANKIFFEILNEEKAAGMNLDAFNSASQEFNNRYSKIDWKTYYSSRPFEYCGNALFNWAPIADELKRLDKEIVLNSMRLKWNNVQKDFKELTNKFEV